MNAVVDVVGMHDPAHIRMFGRILDLDSPVDDNVVENKVKRAIYHYTNPNPEQKPQAFNPHPSRNGDNRNKTEDNGEVIVFLEKSLVMVMMVGVPVPHQTVHNIFMDEPGGSFHKQNSTKDNQNFKPNHIKNVRSTVFLNAKIISKVCP